jgi:PAS domain S-box-containing protein
MGVVFMNFIPLLVTDDLIIYLPLLGFTYGFFLIMIILTPPSRKLMIRGIEEASLSLWKTSNWTRHYGYVTVALALILSAPVAVFFENTYITHIPLMIWSLSFVSALIIERSIWKKMFQEQPILENPPSLELDGESSIIEAYGYFTFNCINQIRHDVNPKVIITVFNEVREELSFVFDSSILGEDGTFSIVPLLDRSEGFRDDQIGYICRSFGYLNSRLLETYSTHTTQRYALDKFNQIYEQTKHKFSLTRYLDEFICSLPDGVGDEDKIALVGQEEFQKIYRKKTTELLESQDRYRVLFYYAIDPIFTHDSRFRLLDVNPSGCSLFGKKESDIVGMNILDLQRFHPEDKRLFEDNIQKIISGKVTSLTDSYRFKSDKENYQIFEITSTGLPSDSESRVITNVCRDITERKQAEEQIKASLQEKEVLLKEVHHRVKNNMQVISSLLSLQSGYITDESMREMLKESQHRIRSMALVHEKLYQSKNFARINLKEYVRALIRDLTRSYRPHAGTIGVEIDIGDMFLGVDQAIPCGLIINELVSNSFRHAFPEGKSGHLSVSLYKEESLVSLVVRDDGVGIPQEIDYANTESLGLRLVNLLARDQLHGNIALDRSQGTEFRITFTES